MTAFVNDRNTIVVMITSIGTPSFKAGRLFNRLKEKIAVVSLFIIFNPPAAHVFSPFSLAGLHLTMGYILVA